MSQGYAGLPAYYGESSDPITPNVGFSLKGMDPIVAYNFVLADTAIGGGGGTAVKVNGSVINNPNFNNTTPAAPANKVNVTWQVDGSGNISAYVSVSGVGTVTSVALTAPAEFSVGGSPITTAGTLAITKATQLANSIWAGPTSGAAAQPTFRPLVAADLPVGTGTVTSVAMTGDGVIFNATVTGSPITTAGTLAPALLTQTANTFLAGPISGGVLAPTFRILNNADLPTTLSSLVEIDVDTIKLDHTNKDVVITRASSGVLNLAGSETIEGSINAQQLATPAAPTVTPTNGAASTWSYGIVARDSLGNTARSALGNTTVGAANLDGTHFNTITWAAVQGASSYDVYRLNTGTSPSTTGKIGNVLAGATLSLVDNGLAGDGSAQPTLNTTGQVVVGNPTAQSSSIGYFVGPGYLSPFALACTATKVTDAAQDVYAYMFVLPFSIRVGQVTIQVSGLGGAGSTITVGIYSANNDGTTTKLIDSGTFNGNSATNQTKAITAVMLQPGTYWFAQSASTATTLTAFTITLNGTATNLINGQTATKVGKAANVASSGVLPSALGAVAKDATVNPVFAQFTP